MLSSGRFPEFLYGKTTRPRDVDKVEYMSNKIEYGFQ
jgi:hypothetical protein